MRTLDLVELDIICANAGLGVFFLTSPFNCSILRSCCVTGHIISYFNKEVTHKRCNSCPIELTNESDGNVTVGLDKTIDQRKHQ